MQYPLPNNIRAVVWLFVNWNFNHKNWTFEKSKLKYKNSVKNSLQNVCHSTQALNVDGLVQKDVTSLLRHWSYVFLALTHRCVINVKHQCAWGFVSRFLNSITLYQLWLIGCRFGWLHCYGPLARLTHWGRDKMAATFQTVFSNAFFNENVGISINILLKFVPKGQINHIPAFVQVMAWRRPGNKPLFEPMMVSLQMHNASLGLYELTHWCLVMPYGEMDLGHIWLR